MGLWRTCEGVSGAYTLIVDGDSSVHWGKGDYSGTDFWNYSGTAVTLFGQKANGNYVLVTTEGTLNAESQVELMVDLGCVNAIRFDGGGSTQMAYDEGLILNHFYFGKTNTNIEKGTSLDTSDISFDLYMEDETYYWASAADVPQAEYLIYDTSWEEVEDISQAEVGDYWLKVLMNGLEQTIKISVVESQDTHIVTFEYEDGETSPVKKSVESGKTVEEPETPTREGYTFVEWQLDGKPYDFKTAVTEDITLKAVWDINEYQIQFDTDGGTPVDTQTKEYLSVVDKPENPTKTGYTFVEWQLNGEPYDFETKVTDHMTLKAVWKIAPLDIEESSGYKVNGKYIELPFGIVSSNLSLGLSDIYNIKVYSVKGEVKQSEKIATGDKVQISLDDTLVAEYIVIVKGDTTGDGNISIVDVGKLYQYLKNKITMDECYVLAGDVVMDEEIRITDVGKLYQFIKGKISNLEN